MKQSMNVQYNILRKYLPYKCFNKDEPILVAYNVYNIILLYSFDNIKKVIYISNSIKNKYEYISLYEFNKSNYRIVTSLNEFKKILNYISEDIPF